MRTSEREITKPCAEKQFVASEANQLIKQEEHKTGDTGFKPYIQYLNQHKGFFYFSIGALSHIAFLVCGLLQNSWMASNVDNRNVSNSRLVLVYSLIGVISILFVVFRSLFTVLLGLESSKSLFSQLLTSLFRAPMSFYDSTPIGTILSRVSADLSVMDIDISFSLILAVGGTSIPMPMLLLKF